MTREQIQRMAEGFAADMLKVMCEPQNMSKEPQFEELTIEQLRSRLVYFAHCVNRSINERGSILQRECLHVANYAMMIHHLAEQRRLEERGEES